MKSLEEWLAQQGTGTRLRALRAQAGLTGKALAESLGWAQSKVSRIETGNQTPTVADVEAWARATGASEKDVEDLLRLREESQVVNTTFGARMREGQESVQKTYTQITSTATLVRFFETAWIPGVLQVPEYTRRVFAEMVDLHHLQIDDVDAAVAERQERTRLLYDPARQWEFLLAEPVLRWVLPAPAVMRSQLDRLQTIIGLDNVRFGIVPMGRQIAITPQNAVEVYHGEETVAVVETFIGETWHRGEEADAYNRAIDRLWEEAAEGTEARDLIVRAVRALGE